MEFFPFGKINPKINAVEMAQLLFEELTKDEYDLHLEIPVPSDRAETFLMKFDYYKYAALFSSVLIMETKNFKFVPVREHLHSLIFRVSEEDLPEALEAMKFSILDLNELSGDERVPWAKAWFASIGIDQNNPAILETFATYWMEFLKGLYLILKELDPVLTTNEVRLAKGYFKNLPKFRE
jgi:hypothetical protein